MKTLRFIDLFAGIGGMRTAAENNGLKCVFSSEIDSNACNTYFENFGEHPAGDITKISGSDIPNFDLLIAGFPCQPFSYAGDGKGLKDRRGNLFFEITRILKVKRPAAFLLENVKGLISHDQGKTLKTIEAELRGLGYSISWALLNSKDYGLAQNRERWYCVGFKEKTYIQNFRFPNRVVKSVTLKDIVEDLDDDSKLRISESWVKRLNRHFANKKDERVRHFDFGQKDSKRAQHGVFSFLKQDKSIRFHMGDYKKTQIQEGFFISAETDFAPTLIAGRVPQLWDHQRRLSIRECAKLQGFPANFKFPCNDSQTYKQLGNSVSIPVVQRIIKQINLALSSNRNRQFELD